ncbi:unnamed protein product [Clavelina lepadiformis]|uniref:Uncharacterized protein n=1 Tax=Clavelina lepadiformis TaxID=159417 RepID=A0ABP0EY81_CLALP
MESAETLNQFYVDEIQRKIKRSRKKTNKRTLAEETCQTSKELKKTKKLQQISKREVEVVVFKCKKRELSKESKTKTTGLNVNENFTELSNLKTRKLLDKLQWDVTSFGLEGFSKEEKRKLEQERAVNLGAKPKKRPFTNYKVFMEEQKRLKLENSTTKPKKEIDKKKGNGVFWKESKSLKKLGQVGIFKDGVLKLSSKDVKSIKSK